jgi:hypothetical protein
MNLNLKAVIATALLAATPAMALAQTVPTSGPAPGPGPTTGSGLMAIVYDSTTHFGFIEWLGNTFSSFSLTGSDGATTQGKSLDFGTLGGSAFSSFASSAISAGDNVEFAVVAASIPGGGQVNSILSTGPLTGGFGTTSNTAVTNLANTLNSALGAAGSLYSVSNCNPCQGASASDPAVAVLTSLNTNLSALNAGASQALWTSTSGASLGFYQVTNGTGLTGKPTATQYKDSAGDLGTWALSSTGDLTYTMGQVSNVPLPAAGWLLVSGLMGLLGVGRRRARA